MKTHTRLFLACVAVALVASCASPVERRMNRNPDLFAKLTESDKESVRSGRIKEGMSKDAVFFLWGRPARVSEGVRDGRKFERWSYTDFEQVYGNNIGFGMGYGRFGCGFADPFFFGGPVVTTVPVQGASVEFVNGKVTGFLVPR